jgi:hypothetical protein
MTSGQRKLIFILAGVGGLMIVGFMAVMFWWTIRNLANQKPITEAEKRLVFSAQALVPLGFEGYDPEAESYTVLRQFGTRNIHYSYDSRDLEEPKDFLVVQAMTEIHPQSLNAVQSYQMQKLALKAGVAVAADAKMADTPGLLRSLGAEGYAGTLNKERPIGNVFLIRQGKAIHMVTISGMYFNDPDQVKALLGPLLVESKKQLER